MVGSYEELFQLLPFGADWGWRGATPKTIMSRAQGDLVDTRAKGLALWVRELT